MPTVRDRWSLPIRNLKCYAMRKCIEPVGKSVRWCYCFMKEYQSWKHYLSSFQWEIKESQYNHLSFEYNFIFSFTRVMFLSYRKFRLFGKEEVINQNVHSHHPQSLFTFLVNFFQFFSTCFIFHIHVITLNKLNFVP